MVTKEDKIINKKMEALVSTLASQYALSPGGVRNLIKRTMDTEQVLHKNLLEMKNCGWKRGFVWPNLKYVRHL